MMIVKCAVSYGVLVWVFNENNETLKYGGKLDNYRGLYLSGDGGGIFAGNVENCRPLCPSGVRGKNIS